MIRNMYLYVNLISQCINNNMAEKKQLGNSLETVQVGFANGISSHLAKKQSVEGPNAKLTQEE